MAFLPWHLASVPSKYVEHQGQLALAPKVTEFKACLSHTYYIIANGNSFEIIIMNI